MLDKEITKLGNKRNPKLVSNIVLVLIFLSCKTLQAEPHIKFDERELDFGILEQRVKETRIVDFSNTGDDTLRISRVRTTCGCTAAIVSSKNIPPGGKGSIKISFSSSTYVGKISRHVKVHTNDPSNQILDLTIKADVLPPKIKLYFFYSQDCAGYNFIQTKIIAPLSSKYSFEIEYLEISSPGNYERLIKLEKWCNNTGNRIPIIIIGNSVLQGKDEIVKNLENKIEYYSRRDFNLPDPKINETTVEMSKNLIHLAYFYGKNNLGCDRSNYELKYLENKYPQLLVRKFNIEEIENKKLLDAICVFFEVPEQIKFPIPIVFIGDEFFIKKDIASERLRGTIEKYLPAGSNIPWEEIKKIEKK